MTLRHEKKNRKKGEGTKSNLSNNDTEVQVISNQKIKYYRLQDNPGKPF